MNSVNLIGNIGHDLEVRYIGSGEAVLNFNIAVSEGRDKTTWVRIVAWEKLAETINQYCGKGSKIGVTGALQQNKWTRNDGTEEDKLEVRAIRVDFLDPKGSNQGNQSNQNNQQQDENPFANVDTSKDPFKENDATDVQDSDLPF